ncbi:unnamed protein product [Trifolium pratense]|uniref:Uncharacterized protein n=1 Tax=Trifolium pratense TaxID=57577 RepID=A0ACB0KXC2_TRIPR|nr:unnamed protein product [Trifolium pratense]
MTFTVVLNHGGLFVREWDILYKDGKTKEVQITDTHKWSYLDAVSHVEDIIKKEAYIGRYRLWWKRGEKGSYKMLRVDKDANEVRNYAIKNQGIVNMYVEHGVELDDLSSFVTIPKYVNAEELDASDDGVDVDVVANNQNDKGKGVMVESEDYSSVDDYNSEHEDKGIPFDDSEDERTLGGFGEFSLPSDATINGSNRADIEGKSYTDNMEAAKKTKKDYSRPTFDCGYVSDELNSSDPEECGKEKEGGAHASLQNTSTAADQSTSSAQVETTAAAPIQTTTSTPVNVGVHRVNKKARITQPITIPHSATSESTQNHNPTTASATASKSRRKQLRRSGRICRGNPVQVDRVEPEPDVEIQQVNADTSNLKGPSATASKCRIKQKNVDCSQLRRSERLCRDNPFPVDRLEPEPHVEIQIDHADTSNLKGPSATASKCRIKKKNVDCSQLRRSGRLCRDNPVAVDHVEPQPHVEIQIDDVETSNLKSPSKVKATASSKGSKSKKPVKKLDFTKLRRSGRTFYSGPKLKLGAPGTLKDNPITIDDIEEGDGEINTDDVDERGADLTREIHDSTQQQFYDPRVGICLAAMRKWP